MTNLKVTSTTIGRLGRFRLILCMVMVSLMFYVYGCTRDETPSEERPIKIGAVLALTGPASFIGKPEEQTLRMLVDQAKDGWRGKKVQLEILDSSGDMARAKAHVETLMSKGAFVVIGPSTTGESLAVRDLAASYKIPLISLAAGHKIVEPPMDWVFKTAQSDSLAVEVVYGDIANRGLKRIVFLFAATGFGRSGAKELERLADTFGLEIAEKASFAREDTDLSGVVNRLLRAKPEALVIWGTSPGPADATRSARAFGFSGPIYQSHGVASQKFIELAGKQANGVRLPASKLLVLTEIPKTDPQWAQLTAYAEAFQKSYPHKQPSHFGGHAWDAFHMVKRAVLAGADTPAELRDHLETSGEFAGVTGVFRWNKEDHHGLTNTSFALLEIKDDSWSMVDR